MTLTPAYFDEAQFDDARFDTILVGKIKQISIDLLSLFKWEGSIEAIVQSGQIIPSIQKGQIEAIVDY